MERWGLRSGPSRAPAGHTHPSTLQQKILTMDTIGFITRAREQLSNIGKVFCGPPSTHPKVFKTNQPMPLHFEKIHPEQVLRLLAA